MFKENNIFGWNWNDFKKKLASIFNCFKKNNISEIIEEKENPVIGDIDKKIEIIPFSNETLPPVKISSIHLCLICKKNPTEVILAPCGHKCLCDVCYQKYKSSGKMENCPYCREKIESVLMKIFNI